MEKKTILLSSLIFTTGLIASVLAFSTENNLFAKAKSEDGEPHQIIFGAEDASVEKEDVWTKYFKLHQENATRSGYSIDSTPGECLIVGDNDTGVGGDSICFGEAYANSGTYVSLTITIPLTNIQSFTSVVLRGEFYRDYGSDKVTEIQFGNERFFTDEFYVDITHEYRRIILYEIEINYTCAI